MQERKHHISQLIVRSIGCLLLLAIGLPLCAQTRFNYFLLEAERQRMEDHYDAAMELYRHCLQIHPNAPEALFGMGVSNYMLQNDSIGNRQLHMACAIDSCNPWYLNTLASIYIHNRDTERVIPILERLALLEPKRSDVHSQLATIYQSIGDRTKAITSLNRIEHNEGISTSLSLQKQSLYLEMGDTASAIAELEALRDAYPHDMTNKVIIGNQYEQIGRPDIAEQYFDEVRQRDPQNGQLMFAMLSYYLTVGDSASYEATRDSMLFASGSSPQMRYTMLTIYIDDVEKQGKDSSLVWAAFDSLLAVPQEDTSILTLKALYQQQKGCSEEELSHTLRDILQIDPGNKEALSELLEYYSKKSDYAALEEICRQGINYDPEGLAYYYFLTITLINQDKQADAAVTLRQGIERRRAETNPAILADIFALLGDLEYELKHTEASFAAYDSCLAYNPEHASCLNNYAYYLSLRNEDLDRAEEMSYRSIREQPDNHTFLDTYAWILFMKEDYTGARRYMERVVNPTISEDSLLADANLSGVVLEHAGDIYAQCNQMDEALYYWQLALQRDQTGSAMLRKKIKKKRYIKPSVKK